MILTGERPAESEHWYTTKGESAYTIIGKNGKERPTTLRDAKKLGLVPSVTTILKQADRPGLNYWQSEQLLLSALTLPRRELESEKEWLHRVRQDSKEQAKKAAKKGAEIHAAVELWMAYSTASSDTWEYVRGACTALEKFGDVKWSSEKSFAHPDGFGGKVDLHCDGVVIDIKTKEFGPDKLPEGYDEHLMQLAAYSYGLRMDAVCGNLFVSVNNPGLAHLHLWTKEDVQRGLRMFLALLNYWKAKNL